MTVQELIELLQTANPRAEVCIDQVWADNPVQKVDIYDDGSAVVLHA